MVDDAPTAAGQARTEAAADEVERQTDRARSKVRRHRVGAWVVRTLSSPAALAATVLVALGGLMLAFYVALAQINLTDCLANYNEQSAAATAARAGAAAQDRALDIDAQAIDANDRRLKRIDDEGINTALSSLGTANQRDAFAGLLRQRTATQLQREANDADRTQLAERRAMIEEERKRHPLPAPPSQQCH